MAPGLPAQIDILRRRQVLHDVQFLMDNGKAYIGTREISEIDVSGLISMMIGRTLTRQYPPRNARIGECLLEVEGLGDGGRSAHP